MTRDQSREALIVEMQERGQNHPRNGNRPCCLQPCTPHLAGVVLQDPRIHVRAIGSVDHNSWRGVAENQRTPLEHATWHVSEISLQKYAPVMYTSSKRPCLPKTSHHPHGRPGARGFRAGGPQAAHRPWVLAGSGEGLSWKLRTGVPGLLWEPYSILGARSEPKTSQSKTTYRKSQGERQDFNTRA